jgi:PKD repeat protein/predicted GH43/DUF377 family glycosyl hydrolase
MKECINIVKRMPVGGGLELRKGLACVIACIIISASALVLATGRAKAGEPILSTIDMRFTSPGLEIVPAGTQSFGDATTIIARIAMDGQQNWTKAGVVLDLGAPGSKDDNSVNSPSVIYDGGEYKMWYAGNDGTMGTWILYANSTDGMTWARQGVVLSPSGGWPAETNQVHFPAVINDSGVFKMWYTGYDGSKFTICHATSLDGLTWSRVGMVLDAGPSTYDSVFAIHPFVIIDGAYKMWYAGYDGSHWRIIYATSPDGVAWTKQGIALNVGTSGSQEDIGVQKPTVYKEGATYHMWYSGTDGTSNRIFYATSQDSTTWTKRGKVLDLGPSGAMDGRSVTQGSIVHRPGLSYQMWYTGRQTGTSTDRIHYANMTGFTPSASVDVEFYLDGLAPTDRIGSTSVPILPFTPVAAQINWIAGPIGDHFIYAIIDPLDRINETNEANNIASLSVKVVSGVPVADAGPDQSVFRNALTVLDGSGSYDPNGDQLTFLWVQMGGFPLPIFGANTSTPLVIPILSGFYTFKLTLYDTEGAFSIDTTNLTVTNRAPTADAGADQTVAKRTLVVLNGTASSDPDMDYLYCAWALLSGPSVTLFGADNSVATFMPMTGGLRIFQLTADDGDGGVDTDTVQVNVTNSDPLANAGPDMNVKKNVLVTLIGVSSSDPDGDALAFLWTQTGGPAVALTGANSAAATFTPTTAGIYTFSLTVSDGSGGSDSDSVQVNVTNTDPRANAGVDITVRKRTPVVLDGSGSYDADGDALDYLWTQTSGPNVVLVGDDTPTPTFTPLRSGLYRFRLNITDIDGAVDSDFAEVTVTNSNPRAYAGMDATARKKTIVTLDGGGSSDPDIDPLTYAWSQTAGPTVIIVDSDKSVATYTPLVSGAYAFELTVGDGDGGIAMDIVLMTITNSEPLARAGPDRIVRKNVLVSLDGTGSADADGDVLAYVWTQTSGPTASLAGQDTATPSFTPSSVGIYAFRIAVDDGDGGTDTDTVVVTVYGLSPVARLVSSSSMAEVGSSISFDASTSGDSDGGIVEYRFDFGDGARENLTTATTAHTYSESGFYTVTLTVIDGDGNSSSARLTVRITSVPRNILADAWWLLAIIVILAANVVYFALEWRRWKDKAQKKGTEADLESELSIEDKKKV